MTIEEQLKLLIKERYGSVRDFTLKIGMPYSTLDSILKTGIDKAKLENVLKICDALHISADALAMGEIKTGFRINSKTHIELVDLIEELKYKLKNHNIIYNKNSVDHEIINNFCDLLDAGIYIVDKNVTADFAKN